MHFSHLFDSPQNNDRVRAPINRSILNWSQDINSRVVTIDNLHNKFGIKEKMQLTRPFLKGNLVSYKGK